MTEKIMTLKERLATIKAQQKMTTAASPVLEGPAVTYGAMEAQKADAPKEERKANFEAGYEAGDVVRAKLKELGDRQQVNPPPEVRIEPALQKPAWHEVEMNGDKMIAAGGVPVQKETALDTDFRNRSTVGDTCPICGKIFKVLAKHRCKAVQPKSQVDVDAPPLNVWGKPVEPDAPICKITATFSGDLSSGEKEQTASAPITTVCEEPRFFGYVLLINCVEVSKNARENVFSALDLCKPVTDAICKERNVEHWKLVEFGGGAALLAARFRRYWETQKFSGLVELSSRSLEYEAIKDVLIEFADVVYQGIF